MQNISNQKCATIRIVAWDIEPALKLGDKVAYCIVHYLQDVGRSQPHLRLSNMGPSCNVSPPQDVQLNELDLQFSYQTVPTNDSPEKDDAF